MTEKVIVVKDLAKSYDGFAAVNGISFEVYENEVFGISRVLSYFFTCQAALGTSRAVGQRRILFRCPVRRAKAEAFYCFG